jgi:hypothetical protein
LVFWSKVLPNSSHYTQEFWEFKFFFLKSNVGVTHIALMSNYDQFHTYFPLKWLKLEVTEVDQHPCTGHAGWMLTFSGSAIIILFFSMSQI